MAVDIEARADVDLRRRFRTSIDGIGVWWILTLVSTSGIRMDDGPWIQPLLWFAPPVLLARITGIRAAAPPGARPLLGGCIATGAFAWVVALLTGLGGYASASHPLATTAEAVAFVLFCAGLRLASEDLGARSAGGLWRRATYVGAVFAVPGVVLTLLYGLPDLDEAPPRIDAHGGVLVVLTLAFLGVGIAALTIASRAMRATRDWLDRPTAEVPAHASVPVGAAARPVRSVTLRRTLLVCAIAAVVVAGGLAFLATRGDHGLVSVDAAEQELVDHYIEPLRDRQMQVDLELTCHDRVGGTWQLVAQLRALADAPAVARQLQGSVHWVRKRTDDWIAQQESVPEDGWVAYVTRLDVGTRIRASRTGVEVDESAIGWAQSCDR